MKLPLKVAVLASVALVAHAAPLSPEQLFEKLSKSVFVVQTFDKDKKGLALGSAVAIGPGVVITNCHVLRKAQSVTVSRGNVKYSAIAQHFDPERDLCSLKVKDLEAPAVPLGNSAQLHVGQKVYAIGAPLGLELTLTEGLVSSLRGTEGAPRLVQTSAAISPGSSGGGLFDTEGRLVGVTTFQFKGQQLNFALPADWIRELPERHKMTLAKAKETSVAAAVPAAVAPAPSATPRATAPPAGDGSYPRQLGEKELTTHFGASHELDAQVLARPPFQLVVNADGSLERNCQKCKVRFGVGQVTLKAADGLVCIRWKNVAYPDSGCFRVMQVAEQRYELRGANDEQTIAYSINR